MKIKLLSVLILLSTFALGQTVKETNVYPTNLEENMYFESFDQENNLIKNIYCMILSDGENSEFVTPAFEVSLYLLPDGSNDPNDLIIVKKYNIDGIYHFGSYDLKDNLIDLNTVENLKPGDYRLGIWVNSNTAFEENTDDNAMLFKGMINITKIKSPDKDEDEDWDDWDDDEDEEWDI